MLSVLLFKLNINHSKRNKKYYSTYFIFYQSITEDLSIHEYKTTMRFLTKNWRNNFKQLFLSEKSDSFFLFKE